MLSFCFFYSDVYYHDHKPTSFKQIYLSKFNNDYNLFTIQHQEYTIDHIKKLIDKDPNILNIEIKGSTPLLHICNTSTAYTLPIITYMIEKGSRELLENKIIIFLHL